jgi:hypothetical protein
MIVKLVKFRVLYYTFDKLCGQAAQLDLRGEARVLNALNCFRVRPVYQ